MYRKEFLYRRKSLTFCNAKSIMVIGYEGGAYKWPKWGDQKQNPRRKKNVSFRMTKEEYEKLTKYAEEHNLTITEVLHKGVHLLYRTS